MAAHSLPAEPALINDHRIIPLTQGYETIVDEADFAILNQHRWKVLKANGKFYACRTQRQKGRRFSTILMHRQIMGTRCEYEVDHRDGDGLNNRRDNLRLATRRQNRANTVSVRGGSKYKGVYRDNYTPYWVAQIGIGKLPDGRYKVRYLGTYDNEEDAALAYDRAAVALHGEFARVNLPNRDDGRVLTRRTQKGVKRPGGENHPTAKLTRIQAAELKRRAKSGENRKQLAAEFGVSHSLVWAIFCGRCWKDLP